MEFRDALGEPLTRVQGPAEVWVETNGRDQKRRKKRFMKQVRVQRKAIGADRNLWEGKKRQTQSSTPCPRITIPKPEEKNGYGRGSEKVPSTSAKTAREQKKRKNTTSEFPKTGNRLNAKQAGKSKERRRGGGYRTPDVEGGDPGRIQRALDRGPKKKVPR